MALAADVATAISISVALGTGVTTEQFAVLLYGRICRNDADAVSARALHHIDVGHKNTSKGYSDQIPTTF